MNTIQIVFGLLSVATLGSHHFRAISRASRDHFTIMLKIGCSPSLIIVIVNATRVFFYRFFHLEVVTLLNAPKLFAYRTTC